MSESLAQIFSPFYFILCAIFPEFNVVALLSIGKLFYEPRLSIIYPFSLNHINLLILIFHLILFGRRVAFRQLKIPHFMPFLIFILWLIVSSLLLSHFPDYALEKLISLLVFSVLSIILIAIRVELKGTIVLQNVLLSLLFISSTLAVFACIKWIQTPGIYRLSVLGGGPIGLGRMAGVGLIILMLLKRKQLDGLLKYQSIFWVLTGALSFSLLLTLTKGPLIGLILTLLMAGRITKHAWLPRKRIIILAVGLIFLCILIDFFRKSIDPAVSIWYGSYVIRIEHTIHALNAFIHNPIWGIGLGNFSEWGNGWLYPHNLLMEVLSETGVIGFILLGIVLYPMFTRFIAKKNTYQTVFIVLTLFMFLNQMVSSDIIGARFLWFYYYLYMIAIQYGDQKLNSNSPANVMTNVGEIK